MLIPIFLPILEKSINQYLSFDPEIRARLHKLANCIIRIEITTIDFSVYLTVHNEKIRLLAATHEPINASLKGTPLAFAAATMQTWQGSSTPPKDIEISGDIHCIQTMTEIFRSVDIDWEELLSACSGDIIAHQVGNFGRGIKHWLVDTTDTLKKNLSEYLQEELELLPPRLAVEDFYDDVYQLRDDIERIEIRFENLDKK